MFFSTLFVQTLLVCLVFGLSLFTFKNVEADKSSFSVMLKNSLPASSHIYHNAFNNVTECERWVLSFGYPP